MSEFQRSPLGMYSLERQVAVPWDKDPSWHIVWTTTLNTLMGHVYKIQEYKANGYVTDNNEYRIVARQDFLREK